MIERVMDLRPDVEVAVQMGFDYAQVDEGIRDEVKLAAKVIRAQARAWRSSMVSIGKRLIEVKGMLEHGQFGEWIAAEFEMSDRMARNFMNVARLYEGKTEIISVLSDTVLYTLAAPSTPEAARVEVEERAASGEKITVATVNEVKAKHAEPKAVPVQYSPYRVLETMISEWVSKYAGESSREPLEVLQYLEEGSTARAESLRERLAKWLSKNGVTWRIGDLPPAVKRVRERRQRPAGAQEGAR